MNDSTLAKDEATNNGQLRVHDSGRALWLMTVCTLVLGYAALTALTGGETAPRVDVEPPLEAGERAPAAEATGHDRLYRLRPQTSTARPLSGHDYGRVTSGDGLLPAVHWDVLSPPDWDDDSTAENESLAEPGLFR